MNSMNELAQFKNNPWSAHTLNVLAFLISNVGLLLLLESLVQEYEPLLIVAISATSILFLYVVKKWFAMHRLLVEYVTDEEVKSTIIEPVARKTDNYLSVQIMVLVGSEYAFMLSPHFDKMSELSIALLAGAALIVIAYSAYSYVHLIRAQRKIN